LKYKDINEYKQVKNFIVAALSRHALQRYTGYDFSNLTNLEVIYYLSKFFNKAASIVVELLAI